MRTHARTHARARTHAHTQVELGGRGKPNTTHQCTQHIHTYTRQGKHNAPVYQTQHTTHQCTKHHTPVYQTQHTSVPNTTPVLHAHMHAYTRQAKHSTPVYQCTKHSVIVHVCTHAPSARARTHTCTHTHMHACTNACDARTHMHACTHAHMHTCTGGVTRMSGAGTHWICLHLFAHVFAHLFLRGVAMWNTVVCVQFKEGRLCGTSTPDYGIGISSPEPALFSSVEPALFSSPEPTLNSKLRGSPYSPSRPHFRFRGEFATFLFFFVMGNLFFSGSH